MLLNCSECGHQDLHLLEPDKTPNIGRVICIECGKEIANLTRQTKVALQAAGQVKRPTKQPLEYTCKNTKCGYSGTPTIKRLGGTRDAVALCKKCGQSIDIHPSFIQALKMMAENNRDSDLNGKEDLDDASRPATIRPRVGSANEPAKSKTRPSIKSKSDQKSVGTEKTDATTAVQKN